MKKFILNVCLFFGYTVICLASFIALYMLRFKLNTTHIPALNVSDSYSYNEKMGFIRNKQLNGDIIALGSSITLNNLESNLITEEFHSNSYLNTSSWGMTIKDDYLLLKVLYNVYKPKTLIMCSEIVDFQEGEKNVKYDILERYLSTKYYFGSFWKTFSLNYFFKNFRYTKRVRTCRNEYEYLNFDRFGGVALESYNFKIDKARWNRHTFNYKCKAYHYSYLDSISNFCNRKNIKLIFFLSPVRNGVYSKLNKEEKKNLQTHTNNIKLILTRHQHLFVDSNTKIWDDSLFVDATHLNRVGANLFTKYCLDQLKRKNL